MRRLRRYLGAAIIVLGSSVACVSALGLMALGASVALPPGWLGWAAASELRPPSLTVSPPDASAHERAIAPTPDFSLGADVPRLYYLWIPRLGLYAPVVAVAQLPVEVEGRAGWTIDVPKAFAVGWSTSSAPVGAPGNTVFVGHNNEFGDVFKDLWYLRAGDEIVVQTGSGDRHYVVSEVAYFLEKDRPLAERLANAHWIASTADERLTLVTCWPYYSNTHRLVVVAVPQA